MTTTTASFAPLLERFFTQRLMQQRQASPHAPQDLQAIQLLIEQLRATAHPGLLSNA